MNFPNTIGIDYTPKKLKEYEEQITRLERTYSALCLKLSKLESQIFQLERKFSQESRKKVFTETFSD